MKRTGFAALCGFVLICTLGGCGSTSPRSSPTTTTTTRTAGTSGPSPTTDTPTPDEPTTSTPASTSGPGTESTTATSTTTPAIDTAVVPKVITVAYVDAVLAKLDAINGDALRSAMKARSVSDNSLSDLYAIFSQSIVGPQIEGLDVTVRSNFSNIRRPPGDESSVTVHLIHASLTCIFAQVHTSFNAVTLVPPKSPTVEYEGLRRATILNVKEGDPTPWQIFLLVEYFQPYTPPDPCI